MSNPLKQHKFAIIFCLAAVVLVASAISNQLKKTVQSEPQNENAAVKLIAVKDYAEQKTIRVENGTVQSLSQADLKSQMTAAIAQVNVKLGDNVSAGQTIMQLQSKDIQAQLAAAQANLESLQKGSRPEDLAISKTAAEESRAALINSIKDAYAKSDDSIHNHIDKFFNNPGQSNAEFMVTANVSGNQITLQASNAELAKNISRQKYQMENMLAQWQQELSALNQNSSSQQIESALTISENNLQKEIDFLNAMSPLVNDLSSANSTYKTIIDGYKTEFSAARSTTSGSLAGLQGAETAWRTANRALDLKQAGATAEQLRQAQASVDALNATLAKTSVISPISGKISFINGRVGELASAGTLIASVVNPNALQIKAYVSENDLPTITENAPVTIDGGAKGYVQTVAPAVDSQTKKAEINILVTENNKSSIIVGQTAGLNISSGKEAGKTSYLLPIESIQFSGNNNYVFVVDGNNTIRQIPVTVGDIIGERIYVAAGLSDDQKITASTRGLKEGDTIKIQN